ncbi:MarR family transcriptional regulator [Roseomonas sp. F4]
MATPTPPTQSLAKMPPSLAARLAQPAVATPPDPVDTLRRALVTMVRSDAPDLSARQLAVLLTASGATLGVRELACMLNISKPAVTRAIDTLVAHSFAQRDDHPTDRRQIVVTVTPKGDAFLALWRAALAGAVEARQ